jgi:amino-acid N-acetyltransferase
VVTLNRDARPAAERDLPAIAELLASVGLPTADLAAHVENFVVHESGGSVVAVGGLEVCGRFALLRSVAVAPGLQGHGLGGQVCDRLEAIAKERGVSAIYLLTETAVAFFAKRGYVRVARDTAPLEIAATEEYSRLCPASAVLMRRDY